MGLSIIFGQMNVFNLAHGEFYMLGSYATVIISLLKLPPWVGILFAPIFVGCIGMLVERIVIRPLYKRPFDTLLVTWGLSMVLKQVVQLIFGASHRDVKALFRGSMQIFGADYPIYRLFIILSTLILLIVVYFLYFKTSLGLQMRMVTQNREQANAMGVNASSIDRWSFAIGAALAGIAGAIMTPLMFVNPSMGEAYLTNAFIVVIIGGVSSLLGVIGGGLIIGYSNTLIDYVIKHPFITNIVVLVLAIIVIRIKPKGVFTKTESR